MGLKIFLDGEFVEKDDAKVSIFDHGLLYGDGIFEGIRAYNGKVFKLKNHIDRLFESAQTIMLKIPMTKQEVISKVEETVKINNLKDAYIRLVVTRGKGDLGLDPAKCPKATIFIIADKISLFPDELYEKGMKVITVPTRRNFSEALNPRIKSLNYLNNIMAKIEAKNSGVIEAVMLNHEGYVAEGTGENIFIVKDQVLIAPPNYVGALSGITRQVVIEIAQKKGIVFKEILFCRHELFNADECFFTGTAAKIVPVVNVDGRIIGSGAPGELTKKFMAAFRDLVSQ